MSCCSIKKNQKKCKRKDGKIFKFPRKFSKKKCKNEKGFTMRSSCAPYKFCKIKGGRSIRSKNLYKKDLSVCSLDPLTGWKRNGKCEKFDDDYGTHTVCANMDKKFLDFTKSKGNNLYSVVKPGDKWCLCENRWEEAYNNGKAPKVILEASNYNIKFRIKNKIFKSLKRNSKKKKVQFLYNPNNPKKSFDVYVNKNPNDTIPIKYTTIDDVKNTIRKLEKLYKQKKYTHKRIWRVGMIMKVRLEAMLKNIHLYPKAKNIKKRFLLANKYFIFLGTRTKTEKNDRYNLEFKF
jgi:uncharacterized protein